MNTLPSAEQLNDLCLKALVRCFRKEAGSLAVSSPRVSNSDLHNIRLHWAFSKWVEELADRVVQRPREAQEVLENEAFYSQGEIPGIIDARATIIEQTVTGNPCVFIGEEPNTTLFSGPNHLVAWTLSEALRLVHWAQRHANGSKTPEWLSGRAKLLENALRSHALREVLASPQAKSRPSTAALRAASKSRAELYRRALKAFRALQDVEALDRARLREMFSQTLVSAMENWQRFELTAALCATEALSQATGQPIEMALTFTRGKRLAAIGPFWVTWQLSLGGRDENSLDPSEKLVRTLATSLGVSQCSGFADCAVFHESNEEIPIALIECKWFESVSARNEAIIDACTQMVRYARNIHPNNLGKAEGLLQRSLVLVTWHGDLEHRLDGSGPIYFADFYDLETNALEHWARVLTNEFGMAGSSAA